MGGTVERPLSGWWGDSFPTFFSLSEEVRERWSFLSFVSIWVGREEFSCYLHHHHRLLFASIQPSNHPKIQFGEFSCSTSSWFVSACLPLFFFLGFGAPLHLTHPYLPNLLLLEGACWIVLPSSSASIGIWWGDVAECWSSSPNKQKGKGEREMIDAWDQL